MAVLRATALVLATLAGAAMLLWSAASIDLPGTVANLVADVLVGSVIVLVVRSMLLRKARAGVVDEVSGDRTYAMAAIREFVQDLGDSARALSTGSMGSGSWSDPMFVLNEQGFHWRCDYVRAGLRVLSGHHGGLNLRPLIEEIIAGSSQMWPLVRRARACTEPGSADRSAVVLLQQELDHIVSDLQELAATIADSYDPRNIAVLRHPDQFPPWLRRVFWVCAIAAGVAWGAFYLLPDTIPRGVADGTTNNVLTAGAAALVGTALVFVAQASLRRRKTRSARPYFLRVVQGCFLLDAWLEGKIQGVTKEHLDAVADGIDHNMERLQHIIPDAVAARYKRDLLAELGRFLARPGGPAQSPGLDGATSVEGRSIERRLGLQATIDVMLERVVKVYSDQASFLDLDDEEVLPPDLFSDLPDRGDRPVTTFNTDETLLLVAIVEMAPGQAMAGRRYEDAVLALLDRHGGSVERRLRDADCATEVHVIRFRSRAGYESFMADPDRLGYRADLGAAAPTTRVLEVHEA